MREMIVNSIMKLWVGKTVDYEVVEYQRSEQRTILGVVPVTTASLMLL